MVRKIRAKLVLQLREQGFSGRQIAASQGWSRHSVVACSRLLPGKGSAGTMSQARTKRRCMRGCSPAGVCMAAFTPSRSGLRCTANSPGSGYPSNCFTGSMPIGAVLAVGWRWSMTGSARTTSSTSLCPGGLPGRP